MKKGDYLIIAAIAVAAGLIFLTGFQSQSGPVTVLITQNEQPVYEVIMTGLKEPVYLQVGGKYQNDILIAHDGVRVTDATCPHKTCVHTGLISKSGQSIICLENRVIIRISGAQSPSGLDGVVR